jgi:hypothetical protein
LLAFEEHLSQKIRGLLLPPGAPANEDGLTSLPGGQVRPGGSLKHNSVDPKKLI